MVTSFFSSSSSFSFCFFLPPPFSAVVAAGEYSRPAFGFLKADHLGETEVAQLKEWRRAHGKVSISPRPGDLRRLL